MRYRRIAVAALLSLSLLIGTAAPPLAAQPWEGLTSVWEGGQYGYQDANGSWAVPPMFDRGEPFDETGYAVVEVDGKCGLIDHTGAYAVEPAYAEIDISYEGGRKFRQLVGEALFYGIMAADGAIRVPATLAFEWMGPFSEGVSVYKEGGKYGILDGNAGRITEPVYDMLEHCTDGVLAARKGELYGLVAKDGAELTQFQYDSVRVKAGYAVAELQGKRGLLDTAGNQVLPLEYDLLNHEILAEEGMALVQQEGGYGVVRLADGELVVPCAFAQSGQALLALELGVSSPDQLWEGSLEACREAGLQVTWYPDYEGLTRLYGSERMLLRQNGLYALCGLDGTSLTGFVFDAVDQPSADGTILAMKGGRWGKIDQDGNVLEDFVHTAKEEAKAPVNVQILRQGGLFAVADLEGNLLTGYDYWNAREFVNGYAALQNNQGLWGYIDGNGKTAVPFRYASGGNAVGDMGEDGFAIIQTYDADGWHVVDIRGEELFEAGMRKIWRAGQGMWGFSRDAASGAGTIGFADSRGNIVVEPQYVYYTSPKGELYGGIFNENGVAEVYTDYGDGARVLIDTTGAVVESAGAAPGIREDSQGLYMTERIASEGPWGFQDAEGNLVVPCIFEAVGRFENNYASVRAGGVYGLLLHPELTPEEPGKQPAGELEEAGLSIAWVETENSLSALGRDHLVTEYKILGREGMMGQKTWGDYGLRTAEGALIVPVQYGTTLPGGVIGDGYFAVAESEGVYTDHLGSSFTQEQAQAPWNPPELDVFRAPGPDGTLESGKYGYADPWTGEEALPAVYDRAMAFSEGIGIVWMGDRMYAIDRTGAELFDLSAYRQTAPQLREGRLAVQGEDSSWGYVDNTGALVIPAQWDSAGDFSQGLAVVRKGTSYGYIDLEGNGAAPCVLEAASSFKDDLAVITHQGRQGILKHPAMADTLSFWAEEEMAQATAAGYVTPRCGSYQTFEITRLQFAELSVNYLEKAAGRELEAAPAGTFTDTEDEAVLKAYAAGIVQGKGDGTFDPKGPLTRQALAAMLYRAMGAAGTTFDGAHLDFSAYSDGAQVADWAQEAMSALVSHSVLQGDGAGRLMPQSGCTVEQGILLVWRAAQ